MPEVDGPSAISLFTCGMGMDIGFAMAGFRTRYANDITGFACDTIRRNRPDIHCDRGDVTAISSDDMLRRAGTGRIDIVIGGPPCQSFSTAGARRGLDDRRGAALLQYIRVIRDVRPKFFVFENVQGLLSAPKKHVPFYERKAGKRLQSDEEYGSLFAGVLGEFGRLDGYRTGWRVLNAADYGVPQKRKRLIIIGSRTADPEAVFDDITSRAGFAGPSRTGQTTLHPGGIRPGRRPWRTLRDALAGMSGPVGECMKFPRWGKYLRHVPPGGCWVDLPKHLQRAAMGGAADTDDPKKRGLQGGRRGFYRRLSWDAPAPTLVTSPAQLGSCMCHPDEDRPLSVREYARIQGFPDDWEFVGSMAQKYRMIGEAVPVGLARAIAESVRRHL